jgi:hypothetical protein
LACTDAPTIPPCGTLATYDVVNDKTAPIRNGFSAGTYVDGSNVYVGLGDNTACFGETMAPCRLKATDPAGCYIASCGKELFVSKPAQYVVNHPWLKWVPVTSATVFSTNGLTYAARNDLIFKYARIKSSYNGVNYVTIGKGMHYYNGDPNNHDASW